jgi:predicted small lipoprotein YifL
MQRLLQVHNDLTAVGKSQGHHAAGALVVDIGVAVVIDAITPALDGTQQGLGLIQVLKVGHYNRPMKKKSLKFKQILGADRCASGLLALMLLGACGQKGALYLPPPEPKPTAAAAEPKSTPPAASTVRPAQP